MLTVEEGWLVITIAVFVLGGVMGFLLGCYYQNDQHSKRWSDHRPAYDNIKKRQKRREVDK